MKFLTAISAAFIAALTLNTGYAQQICNSNVEETTPNSRFVITEGEALDTKTGLIWRRCLHGKSWNEETKRCDGYYILTNWKAALEGANDGWRVPNIKELGSIVEHSCANPSLNLSVFPGAPVAPRLWSSTPGRRYLNVRTDERVWIALFQDGTSFNGSKTYSLFTMLVKDGDGVDAAN